MLVTKEEFPRFIEIFIEEVANDLGISVNNAIQIVSDYYEMSKKDIRNELKSIDSHLTSNNNIIYFDETHPVKRTTFLAKFMKIIDKIGNNVFKDVLSEDADKSVNELLGILEYKYGKVCYING
jgi:hypothetical protein